MSTTTAANALTLQMLGWLDRQPRTYAETMDAWRTSCPRLSIWEDALADHLVVVCRQDADSGRSRSVVRLTPEGQALLEQLAHLGP